MASLVIFFVFFTFNSVLANSCGGLLEGEYGDFSLADSPNLDQPEAQNSCMWIIQLHYKANIRFRLHALREDSHLNVYPEDELTSCNVKGNTKLNSTHVGSAFEFLGKTLVIVLPNASAFLNFSWEYTGEDNNKNKSSGEIINSDYVSTPNGLLKWRQLEIKERMTWAITSDASVDISWKIDVATNCDATDDSACFYFAIFQLNSKGSLSEAVRTCDPTSKGQLQGISGRSVVLIKVNTKVEANKVSVSWRLDDVTEPPVTEPPVTTPPEPTFSGLFAATETGLVALNLQTLEPTRLTSEETLAVAVNQKLSKVYWSEGGGNSSIKRSNFDGSAKEIIIPPTGENIYMLAIDEPSGNVYYNQHSANIIAMCNALGQDRAAVISNLTFKWRSLLGRLRRKSHRNY